MQQNSPYIIVGDGFAGLFMALELLKRGQKFILYGQSQHAASRKAAGVVNPVILKHFSMIHQHQYLMPCFAQNIQELHQFFNEDIFQSKAVTRVFANEYELKSWTKKARNHQLKHYLNPEAVSDNLVQNPHGMGQIYHSGRLNVARFFELMRPAINQENTWLEEPFDYQALQTEDKSYRGIQFEKIIFCEGLGLRHNPYFKQVPLDANKGHYLQLELSQPLNPELIYKNKYFLFQEKPGQYYYGATNDNGNLATNQDQDQIEELQKHLQQIYPSSYQIQQKACGHRAMPTDRRVILGQHHEHDFIYMLNGLGARGVLNAVCYAPVLYDFMHNNTPLDPEIDVKRYPPTDHGGCQAPN